MILSIDPGKRHAGCALFEDSKLINAWLARAEKPKPSPQQELWPLWTADSVYRDTNRKIFINQLRILVIEKPVPRKGRFQKGTSQKDIVELGIMAGAISGTLRPNLDIIHFYTPEEWKGQVEKEAMNLRVQGRLSPAEARLVVLPGDKKRQTDVWDAVGIGLKYVGRL